MEAKKQDFTIKQLMGRHKKVLTLEVLSKLEEALKNDFTIQEACIYAGINDSSYYNYQMLSTQFRLKMERVRSFVSFAAKRNVAKAVVEGSIEDSWRYLARRQKKLYSTRSELSGEDGEPLKMEVNITNFKGLSDEELQKLAREATGADTEGK